jgi:hypothetical protein
MAEKLCRPRIFGEMKNVRGTFLGRMDPNALTMLGLNGRKGGSKYPGKGEKIGRISYSIEVASPLSS